jgi:predicted DNA binding CopG/RHH family protein
MSNTKIPQIDSIEELARFWDTHDLTDFADELEETSETVFERNKERVLTIRLGPDEAESLKRIAESRGIAETTLIRRWVLEKIHEQ